MLWLIFFVLLLVGFVAVFVTMLGGLMVTLKPRARFLLTLSLVLAFVVLGWRSPNPVLSRLVMTVCPGMVVLAWIVGSLRAARAGKPRQSE